jgi:hypothetical protein
MADMAVGRPLSERHFYDGGGVDPVLAAGGTLAPASFGRRELGMEGHCVDLQYFHLAQQVRGDRGGPAGPDTARVAQSPFIVVYAEDQAAYFAA